MVVELANEAFAKGDEVNIVTGWPVDPAVMQCLINPQIKVQFIGRSRNDAYLKMFFWIVKNRKWIAAHDVIHCHLTMGSIIGSLATIIFRLSFQKKVPVSTETYHAVGMPIPKFNRWLHSRLMLFRNGVVFMAKDPYWDTFIKKHPGLRTAVIPNGVSVSKPAADETIKKQLFNEWGIPDNCSCIVGTVGMLRPERKPELYIPVFKAINQAFGDTVHFILAGDGADYEKIKGLVEKSGIKENIHMTGVIHNPAFAISTMDMYVSVSVGETAGISMIEAALCKVPVVAIQLTEGYTAKQDDWVWSHTDCMEVAKKIIYLLERPDKRRELVQFQEEYVNTHFTSEAMYYAYNTFYKQLLSK